MSVSSAAPRGDAMSVSVIRGLLERNLVERAVALSETRWVGSGPMVRLAHEWVGLSPIERRDRLAAIGPEELARLRGVAELQPDLARVLDDLETRGMIPPNEELTTDLSATPTPEESVVNAVLELAEQRATEIIRLADDELPTAVNHLRDRLVAEREAALSGDVPEAPVQSAVTQKFRAVEADRRAEATERGAEMLERIRRRVDEVESRVATSTLGNFPGAERAPALTVTTAPVVETLTAQRDRDSEVPARADLMAAILSERVYEPLASMPRPGDAELRTVARSMGLDFVRIDGSRYSSREIYGGMVRKGRGIVEEAGFLPRALAGRNLVAFSGRLYPTALARIDEGFFDIPGTRAATRVHPDSRLILLGSNET